MPRGVGIGRFCFPSTCYVSLLRGIAVYVIDQLTLSSVVEGGNAERS